MDYLLIRGFSPRNASKPVWEFSLLVAGDTPENQSIYQPISLSAKVRSHSLMRAVPSALAPQ